MKIKVFIIGLSVTLAVFLDVVLSNSEYPILTLFVCGIVFLYEYISPYIYRSY